MKNSNDQPNEPHGPLPRDWSTRTPEEKAAWLWQHLLCERRLAWVQLVAKLLTS